MGVLGLVQGLIQKMVGTLFDKVIPKLLQAFRTPIEARATQNARAPPPHGDKRCRRHSLV